MSHNIYLPDSNLLRVDQRPRAQWEALERAGLCPECGQRHCGWTCRKRFFDWAYSIGYHDGANALSRHDDAFVAEMINAGVYRQD